MGNSEITFILLVVALAGTLGGRLLMRRLTLHLRPIAAFSELPVLAADAVESNIGIHFGLAGNAVGDASTLNALAAAEIIFRLSRRLVISDQSPLVTVSDPTTLPLAQDTLRRAYEYRHRLPAFRSHAAAWYAQGPHSLAYAAGAASLSADADATSNVLLGRFGYELALLGESSLRHDQRLIAHSDLVEGQAVAYVQADRALIGEELYAGTAYMSPRRIDQGSIIALDLLRWIIIIGMVIWALQAAL